MRLQKALQKLAGKFLYSMTKPNRCGLGKQPFWWLAKSFGKRMDQSRFYAKLTTLGFQG